MKPIVQTGVLIGTGAAINVSLGFVPDYVRVVNTTDGDLVTEWYHGAPLGFDSGSVEIKPGMEVTDATSGAYAIVKEVLLTSGTWAGGDAAGKLVLRDETIVGTFANNNNLNLSDARGYNRSNNVATVDGTLGDNGLAIAAAVALPANAAASVDGYAGVVQATPAGFTIGSAVSESGKVLHYVAMRAGDS